MTQPERGQEIVEESRRNIGRELLNINSELEQLGVLMPESLTYERVQVIQATIDRLEQEAVAMSQPALAEVLGRLRMDFYILHTIGTVDNPQKFNQAASVAFDQLETVLLLLPTTSAATLENIQKRKERND